MSIKMLFGPAWFQIENDSLLNILQATIWKKRNYKKKTWNRCVLSLSDTLNNTNISQVELWTIFNQFASFILSYVQNYTEPWGDKWGQWVANYVKTLIAIIIPIIHQIAGHCSISFSEPMALVWWAGLKPNKHHPSMFWHWRFGIPKPQRKPCLSQCS
jgi:hypothetical protein